MRDVVPECSDMKGVSIYGDGREEEKCGEGEEWRDRQRRSREADILTVGNECMDTLMKDVDGRRII